MQLVEYLVQFVPVLGLETTQSLFEFYNIDEVIESVLRPRISRTLPVKRAAVELEGR